MRPKEALFFGKKIQLRTTTHGGTVNRVGLAAAVAALTGLVGYAVYDSLDRDIVRRGDDGQNYLLPERSERPVYGTRQDCIDDVNANIKKYEEETERDIPQTADELCEPASRYRVRIDLPKPQPDDSDDRYLGPVVDGDKRWNSPRVQQWVGLGNEGGFAPPGRIVQGDLTPAPAGSRPGQIIRYGFGGRGGGGS